MMDNLLCQVSGASLSDKAPWGDTSFGDALLAPTEIYVKRLLSLIDNVNVKVSHKASKKCSEAPAHQNWS